MKKKILLYDDNPDFALDCKKEIKKVRRINSEFDVDLLVRTQEEFAEELEILVERQNAFRKNQEWNTVKTKFDDTSVLIIDYDLISHDFFATAEIVAYLARCFSKCGIIIGLNQFGENRFDLTLQGHMESYCDINIGYKQLSNSGLWVDVKSNYRPWSWPLIPYFLETYDNLIEEVLENLETPIMDILMLQDVAEFLPKSMTDFIGRDIHKVTFQSFCLDSGYGFYPRDRKSPAKIKDCDKIAFARLGASRISKWLRRIVLPAQSILIDAPHLVSRFPSLLVGKGTNVGSWNATAKTYFADDIGLKTEIIQKYEYPRPEWISKRAWFWRELSRNEDIAEVKSPWTADTSKFRFCEDASRFFRLEDCSEFTADVDSSYILRYVREYYPNVDYTPYARMISTDDTNTEK